MRFKTASIVSALVLSGLLISATGVTAQETGRARRAGATAEQRVDRLSEELKLTSEQKTKLKAAMEEQRKKVQEIRNDSSLDQTQRREKTKALREENEKQFKAILTPEQFEKWQKLQQDARSKGPRKGGKAAKSADTSK